MTRSEFKTLAKQALEQLSVAAESTRGRKLPRRYCFSWMGKKEIAFDGDVAEFLTKHGYVDESHIWPCWDLFLEKHPTSTR